MAWSSAKAGAPFAERDALGHVFGYTCFNDGSMRDFQLKHSVTAGKNFPSTGGCGPWIVTADEIPDPSRLTLTTRVNGNQMQHKGTDDMIFGVPAIIAYVSQWTRLEPGDLIATGTPEGVGFARKPPLWLKPGDVVEVEISGIGVLRNPISPRIGAAMSVDLLKETIEHRFPRLIVSGIDYNDARTALSRIKTIADWCPEWVRLGEVHEALGDAALAPAAPSPPARRSAAPRSTTTPGKASISPTPTKNSASSSGSRRLIARPCRICGRPASSSWCRSRASRFRAIFASRVGTRQPAPCVLLNPGGDFDQGGILHARGRVPEARHRHLQL